MSSMPYQLLLAVVVAWPAVAADPGASPAETLEQMQKLIASDGQSDDGFGASVAISGTTAIIGAPLDDVSANAGQGSAYIFQYNGSEWIQQAKLTAEDGFAQDGFGTSVDIDGDTVIIGAENDDIVSANDNQGSAYVFVRIAGTWAHQAKLISSDGTAGDEFGKSVSISGSTVVVGAPGAEVQGAAYVFNRNGASWIQQTRLGAAAPTGADSFGNAVAIDGDTIAVGAPSHNVGPSGGDHGAVFCFTRTGNVWTEAARLTATLGGSGDELGFSVSISGDLIVAGAWRDDIGENTNQGSAYVFVRSGGIWSELPKMVAPDGAAADQFGYSAAVSGDLVVVGARDDGVGSNQWQGSAYAFRRDGATLTFLNKIVASDGAGNDRFGVSVAATPQLALVGAHWDDIGSNTTQGSAYVFQRRSDVLLQDGFE